MSLVMTKLPHYVLPVWPALALLAGSFAVRSARAESQMSARVGARVGRWLLLAPIVVAVAACIVGPIVMKADRLLVPSALLAIVLAAVAGIAVREHARRRHARVVAVTFAGLIVLQILLGWFVLPILDRTKPVPAIMAKVHDQVRADTPLYAYGFEEPSLVFYAHRRDGVRFLPTPQSVLAWTQQAGRAVLVMTRKHLEQIVQHRGEAGLRQIAAAEGIDVAKARKIELVAFLRGDEGARP